MLNHENLGKREFQTKGSVQKHGNTEKSGKKITLINMELSGNPSKNCVNGVMGVGGRQGPIEPIIYTYAVKGFGMF